MSIKIVILDAHTTNPGDLSWQRLSSLGQLQINPRTEKEDIISAAHGANVIITNKCQITKEIIQALPELKCICLLATGYNNINIVSAASNDIVVCNAAGYSTASVAQHIFSMILSVTNGIAAHSNSVHNGDWASSKFSSYTLHELQELKDMTFGIYGFGQIGEAVAKIAHAFGMKIIATRRSPEKHKTDYVTLVSEEELLDQSDFLSLNAPLTEDTKYFINKNSISKMKSTAFLINTGRGQLVNEDELADALSRKLIRGAAIDVLSQEPPSATNPFFRLTNCVLTPHVAWATKASRARLIEIVTDNVENFLRGQPQNVVS